MWKKIWPNLPEAEIPIRAITNGIHTPSWLSPEISQLYDRYLGMQWAEKLSDMRLWDRVDRIPDEELWRTHERRRERLGGVAPQQLKGQLTGRGVNPAASAPRH